MTKQIRKALALVAILVVVSFSAACGSNSPTGPSGNPTPAPTVSTPAPAAVTMELRWEVRTTCGGTHNGAPVASDLVNPPYILPYNMYCYRVMGSKLPNGCTYGGPVTSDQKAFNGSTSWPISGTIAYHKVLPGELTHAADEQDLDSVAWDLNPGTYNWTVSIGWSCSDKSTGKVSAGTASAVTTITIGNPNQ